MKTAKFISVIGPKFEATVVYDLDEQESLAEEDDDLDTTIELTEKGKELLKKLRAAEKLVKEPQLDYEAF
jgi:predicted transcriptional regulator